jgi:hypothetical protein
LPPCCPLPQSATDISPCTLRCFPLHTFLPHKQKPKNLDEAIEKLVAVRLEEERAALAAAYTAKEERLLERIRALEGPAAAAAKPGSATPAKK